MKAHRLAIVAGLVILIGIGATGCSKKVPAEVNDLNRALSQAKDACATVYAADDLAAIQSEVDAMNELADEKKYGKAKKAAEPLLPQVQELSNEATQARAAAKKQAEADLQAARSKMAAATGDDAESLATREFRQARSKFQDAEKKLNDPCGYLEASALAKDAGRLADRAQNAAVAEKRRREEEEAARIRAAEAERRRKEEEARRREEERRKMYPPTWTVVRGDSLWAISGKDRVYGDPTYWVLIYDANSGEIQDPDLIYPGQELKIIRGQSPQEMARDRAEMWRKMSQAEGVD